jgi:hypothetical protein
MSRFDGYMPFLVIENALNKLVASGLLELNGEKEQISELLTQELVQAGVLNEYIKMDRPYPTNRHNTLEEFITEGGRGIFIANMEFDAEQCLFKIDLQFHPDSKHFDKTVIFRGVQSFEEVFDGDEDEDSPDYLDSLVGLDQYSTKYLLRTCLILPNLVDSLTGLL